MPDSPISTPAGYAPAFAIGFSDAGSLAMVDAARPLPVTIQAATGAMPTPLQGSATGTAQAGPFAPAADRAVMLTLSGSWQGTVQVKRSTDGGSTRLPLTMGGTPWGSYAANACEQVWQESESGAALYLDIALTSGTLTYRLAQ